MKMTEAEEEKLKCELCQILYKYRQKHGCKCLTSDIFRTAVMLRDIREKFAEQGLTQRFMTDLQTLERDLIDGKTLKG